MKAFKNAKAYIRGKGIIRTDIAVENGRIAGIGTFPEAEQIFNTGDCLLTAGFIDEHIHGAAGADVMDGTQESLKIISRELAKEGVTAFLATTMTQSAENLEKALGAVKNYDGGNGAKLLGVHLEGPFISPKHIGAQPPEYVLKPSVEVFNRLNQDCGNKIKLVTLAPEEDEEGLMAHIKNSGITVSAGHSAATESIIKTALKSGLSCITHTFNAQSPFNHREIGIAGSAILYDDLFCEVIADTVHVSVSALKLLLKNKPADKIILITDAMRAKGMPDGVYELGGQTVYSKGGRATLSSGTLAGSVLKMNVAVRNIVEKCGVNVACALDFASYNPALNLGIERDYGIIREGAYADFALIDGKFNVINTFINAIPAL